MPSQLLQKTDNRLKSLLLLAAAMLAPGAVYASGGQPELPSFVAVLLHLRVGGEELSHTHWGHIVEEWHMQIILVTLVAIAIWFMRKLNSQVVSHTVPGKLQVLVEMLIGAISEFIAGILGDRKSRHIPVLGTFLLFILMCNLAGLIPFLGAPTSKYQTTVTLAIVVMIYYHYFSLDIGVKNIVLHLLGSPSSVIMWLLSPLFLVINTIEIITRPLSLSLRLYGNVMGKDILLGVFLTIGVSLMASQIPGTWVGIPIHLPFLYLGLMLGVIQALVFTILSSIYLLLWTQHHDDEHAVAEGEAAHGH